MLKAWKLVKCERREVKQGAPGVLYLLLQLKEYPTSIPERLHCYQDTFLPLTVYAELYQIFCEADPTSSFKMEEISYSLQERKAVMSFFAAAPTMPVRVPHHSSSMPPAARPQPMTIEEVSEDAPVTSMQGSSEMD